MTLRVLCLAGMHRLVAEFTRRDVQNDDRGPDPLDERPEGVVAVGGDRGVPAVQRGQHEDLGRGAGLLGGGRRHGESEARKQEAYDGAGTNSAQQTGHRRPHERVSCHLTNCISAARALRGGSWWSNYGASFSGVSAWRIIFDVVVRCQS